MHTKKLLPTIISFLLVISLSSQNTVGLLSIDAEKSFDGFNLIFPHNQSRVFLLDNCGRLVHQWTDDADFRPGNSVYLTHDGNLIKCKRDRVPIDDPIWAGGGGAIVEIRDWDNELLASFVRNDSLYRLHHDIEPLPNGNILMIAWEYQSAEDAIAAGRVPASMSQNKLWSEVIWEWDPIQDSIVWEWRVWDHLIQEFDATKAHFGRIADHPERIDINYDEHDGHPDWLHINAIDYNPVLDQIALSVPYFNEVWVVDHSTSSSEAATSTGGISGKGGDLLYRYGNPAAYQQGDESNKVFFFQHDVQWTHPEATRTAANYGQMSVFNNRVEAVYSNMPIWNSLNEQGDYEFKGQTSGPSDLKQVFTHPDSPMIAFSNSLSGAEILPNGNALLLAGRWGFAYELSPEGEVVWEYRIPIRAGQAIAQGFDLGINDNITFRMNRYGLDHPAFANRDLSPGDYLELSPVLDFCDLSVDVKDVPVQTRFRIFPNPTSGSFQLSITPTNYGHSSIEIFNALGNRIEVYPSSTIGQPITINNLPPGIYFLRIGKQVERLIIQ